MSTTLTNGTRDRIGRYLAGDQTLEQFRLWFRSTALTVVGEGGAANNVELIYAVELLLSEFEHGDWADAELRSKLKRLAAAWTIVRPVPTL